MSELHPLDFAALVKGQFIDQLQVERIYNVRRLDSPDAFRLCQLRLAHDIEQQRRDLLCRCSGHGVAIMTDPEAHEHTVAQYERGVRAISRQVRRRGAIDRTDFDEGARRSAEFWDGHIATQALINRRALAKANRDLLLSGGEPGADPEL